MPPSPAHPHPALPQAGRRVPVWRLLGLALAVLGLHAWVLQGLPTGVGDGWGGGVRPITTLRLGGTPEAAGQAPAEAAPQAADRKAPPVARQPVQDAAAPLAAANTDTPPAPPGPTENPVASADTAASTAAPAASAPPAALTAAVERPVGTDSTTVPGDADNAGAPEATAGGQPPPVYATRPPPNVQLAFDLRRGALQGDAEFAWQHDGQRYTLTMTGSAFSLTLLNWRSTGAFDGAGLAPERFLDSRRNRDQRAANFQRAAGKITFSGPPVEYPLLPGAQDRLSWLVQLAAIVNADPAAFPVGSRISFFVAGSRGEGDIWHFNVLGQEDLQLPVGTVRGALHLQREPRRAYDTGGEVWLDPARHHLPVRVRLTVAQTEERTEFLLRSLRNP